MKISDLYLDGFGHFHQRSIGPLTEPVTVIHGPNEAGKSTLLAFIRTILFGFPPRVRNFYPPQAGGRHGGRVTLVDDDGEAYVVERFAGTGGGLSVRTAAGAPLDGDAVMRRLTGQASLDTFKSVFAFSLDELQSDRLLQEEGVKGYIYGAALGVPKLPDLGRRLDGRKGAIFAPRARNREVNLVLAQLQELDKGLKAVEGNAAHYGSLTARQDAVRQELAEAETKRARLAADRSAAENLLKGWEDWVTLVDCESKLEELPRFEHFPEDPISRLESYQTRLSQAEEDRDETARRLEQALEAAETAIADEDLLEDRDTIEQVRRGRGRFDDSVRDLPERKAELGALENEMNERFRGLGPGWDEARLETFDTSLVVRNEAEQWKQRLEDRRGLAQQTQARMEQERRSFQDRQTEDQEAREKLPAEPPALDAGALEQRRAALRTARGRLNDYQRARQNHENLRSQRDTLAGGQEQGARGGLPNLVPPALLGLAGVILVVAGVIMGGEALVFGIIGGLSLIGVAIYLLLRHRPSAASVSGPMTNALERQVTAAKEAEDVELKQLLDAGAALYLDDPPDTATLDTVEARTGVLERELAVWNETAGQAAEAARRLKQQEDRVGLAKQEQETAASTAGDAQLEWQEWLRERDLAGTFTPDTMIEFLARVEADRIKLEQVRQMRRRVSAIETDIDEYLDLVRPLANQHGVPLSPGDHRQAMSLADSLIDRFDNAREMAQRRNDAHEQAEEHQRALEIREQRCAEADQTLHDLLTAVETDDPEEFRRRAGQNEQRRGLERSHDEILSLLRVLSGPGGKLDAFRDELSQSDRNLLEEKVALLSQQFSDVDANRNGLLEERGGIEIELSRLTGEEESSALRAKRNILVEQLRGHAQEWSKLKLAELLLEKTRQKFERERQPSVIQHAEGFFSTVTGERYQRLYAPVGEQTITVIDQTEDNKEPSQLSRGTREQLYLALRFGLIREFGEQTERLPVVVDEVLVNFDPERALRAAAAFLDLSQTNQVLVFSCHPAVVETFQRAAAGSGYPPPQLVDIR